MNPSRLQFPNRYSLEDFIVESNKIEGILRAPTRAEIDEATRFILLHKPEISDLEQFVSIYQPRARLRDKVGLNVVIGSAGRIVHRPPAGAPKIRKALQKILDEIGDVSPFETHQRYEDLHPFTDGNGRSGRILWLWCVGGEAPRGFLHDWYYASLSAWRNGWQRGI